MIKPKGIPGERCGCSPWEKIKEQIQALYERVTQLGQRDNELQDELDQCGLDVIDLDDRVTALEERPASAVWGDITGDLEDQTDLMTELGTKAATADLAGVAFTGDYDDLIDKPTIPAAPVQSDWNENDSGSLAYIQNKPTIPAAVTVDSTWIQNSENPAESQLIQTALSGKADMSAGAGAPTTSTVGAVGEFYFDTTNKELYQCTGNSGTEPLTYSWQKVGGSGGEDYWMYNYGTSTIYHNGQVSTKEALVQELIDNQIQQGSFHATTKPIKLIYLGWFYQGPFIADLGAWSSWNENGSNVLRSTTCFTDRSTSRFVQITYTNTNGTITSVNITVESYNISPLSVNNTSVSGTHAAGSYQDIFISADAALVQLPAALVTLYQNGAITITHRTDNDFYVRINFVEALTLESPVVISTLLMTSSGSGKARLTIYDNYGNLLLPPASGGSSFAPSTGDIFSTIAGRLSAPNVMASLGVISMGYMQSDGTITALTSGTPVTITDTILGSSVTFTLTPTVFTPDSPSGIYNEGRVAITYNSITRYYSVTNGAWYME